MARVEAQEARGEGQRLKESDVANGKESHDRRTEETLEKIRGLGKTEGYEWVIRTKERLLGDGSGQKELVEDKVEDRIIQIGVFKTEPARVTVQKGLTLNLGNYESARVTVGFETPCYPEEVREIEQVLNDLVEKRLQRETVEIRGKDIRPGYEAKRTEGASSAA